MWEKEPLTDNIADMEFAEKGNVEDEKSSPESRGEAKPVKAGFDLLNKKATVCGDCTVVEDIEKIYVPPVDRLLVPGDIVDIREDDDTVYIIGTKEGKVTKIRGLEVAKNLKVSTYFFDATCTQSTSLMSVANEI